MRYITNLFLAIMIGILLCACGEDGRQETVPTAEDLTWQEQYDLGMRYLSEGKYEEAILAFTAAIDIDPKQAPAYVGLANVYIELGDYEKAQDAIAIGQEACEGTEAFEGILSKLAERDEESSEDQIDLDEMLQSANAIGYEDLPILFSAPFNKLEEYLPIVNRNVNGDYYTYTVTGSGSAEGEEYSFSYDEWSCDYNFHSNYQGNYVMATALAGSTEIVDIEIRTMGQITLDELGYYGPIGLLDILFGDDYATVLAKLGLDAERVRKYKDISIDLCEDGDRFGDGYQAPPQRYNDYPDAPMIVLFFYQFNQYPNCQKHIELVFGEDERLNFVRYLNDDFLGSLAEANKV